MVGARVAQSWWSWSMNRSSYTVRVSTASSKVSGRSGMAVRHAASSPRTYQDVRARRVVLISRLMPQASSRAWVSGRSGEEDLLSVVVPWSWFLSWLWWLVVNRLVMAVAKRGIRRCRPRLAHRRAYDIRGAGAGVRRRTGGVSQCRSGSPSMGEGIDS
ncbi:hypothetical protein CXF35_00145 [Corynebacterium bovis]|uniref:Uncharacterized protein n=1 Tax=Corynebacterium bovis TaxID=36808 RepID=A0A3R8VX77_9CORY|nr:hypothetical protein CXF40_02870 [Corynebacterium bovis]RRO98698.1 hypothetical protein CXF32_00140 [Corynebacterium bovis]RRQ00482.1 hypothetical protein CXF41_06755 [Corynebacterium bovis]RRQ00686.1 hypothetical protein CXF31_00155 [Corynebacterium bovis]RRQ03682.1 hypothetical protein CXF39_03700 [Corynebacterium bovis]